MLNSLKTLLSEAPTPEQLQKLQAIKTSLFWAGQTLAGITDKIGEGNPPLLSEELLQSIIFESSKIAFYMKEAKEHTHDLIEGDKEGHYLKLAECGEFVTLEKD